MRKGLGQLEALFFAYAQMRGMAIVRTGDLTGSLRISPVQERKLLSRLGRAGLIIRIWRGVYLVPTRLPFGGAWTPDEALVLGTLLGEQGYRYQVCGPSAFSRYGLEGQIPNRVYAYNNRLSGERTIGKTPFVFIRVADGRLGDTETARTAEGRTVVYSSRARTLVDAVYDWARFNSLPRGYAWIRGELAGGRVGAEELIRSTLRYGDTGTIRRMGTLLESENAPPLLLTRLERALRPTSGLIPWVPTRPKRGTVNRRWGVVLNEQA